MTRLEQQGRSERKWTVAWAAIRRVARFGGKAIRRGPEYVRGTARFALSVEAMKAQRRVRDNRLRACAIQRGFQTIGVQHADHSAVYEYFASRTAPRFHFAAADIEIIVESVPPSLRALTIAEADAIVHGRFAFRGLGTRLFPGDVDWAATVDDSVSWRWDLNRHRYFVELAAAFHYTGETKYLRRVVALWEQWIAQNSRWQATSWEAPFEVAARLNNWMWTFFLILHAGTAAGCKWGDVVGSMVEHAEHLSHTLEYHWPNNHLLLEAKALAEFAMLFPEFDPRGRYLRRGRKVLVREIQRQVLADGGHSELVPMYHRIVTGELTEWLALLRKNQVAIGRALRDQIEKMSVVSATLLRNDGTMALFGDSASDDNYIRFEPAVRDGRHLNYWIGPPPRAVARDGGRTAPGLLSILPEMGYAVIQDAAHPTKVHITMDVGDFIRNSAPDHGHCDALSFELHARGRRVVIDPGMFFSCQDAEAWRRYLRSTSAHNTVTIDGREQSQLLGSSDVGKRAKVRLLEAGGHVGSAMVRASMQPYWGNGQRGVIHTRTLRYESGGAIEIEDEIGGVGEHLLTWHFHFAPDLSAYMGQGGECEVVDDRGRGVLWLATPQPSAGSFRAWVARGSRRPMLGWSSENSTTLLPASVAVYEIRTSLSFKAAFSMRCL